jgi:capsular polysaccharide biosynthesis protein
MKRYAETFFRYWLIALAPFVVLSLVGAAVTLDAAKTAQATAKLWVDPSAINSANNNQFETPAQNEQDALNQLLQLSSFDWAVARGSPLYMQMLAIQRNKGDYLKADLQKNVQFTTGGPNLLFVSYTYSGKNWQQGLQVVQSAVNVALNQTQLFNQQQTAANISYYQYQLQSAQQQLSQASQAFAKYMVAHHYTAADLTAQVSVDATLASLQQQVQAGQQSVSDIRQRLAALKLQSTASLAVGESGLRVADPATAVVLSSKKKQIMALAIYLVIGLLLSVGVVVVKTLMDRSLRYASEVPEVLDLPVLAVVPYTPALTAKDGKDGIRRATRPTSKGPTGLHRIG